MNRIQFTVFTSKEMCGTIDSSFQSSNALNNTRVWSLIELASLYTVPLSAVNGFSCLTTTSNGQARLIQKFSNRPMTFQSNRNGQFESNLEASQVPISYGNSIYLTEQFKWRQLVSYSSETNKYKCKRECYMWKRTRSLSTVHIVGPVMF